MIKRYPAAAFAALALWSATALAAAEGFRVDLPRQPLPADVMAAIQTQFDVVEAAALPPQVLAAMKQTPVVIDPELQGKRGAFIVRRGIGAVHLRPMVFPPNTPVLLHELLHAYHFNVLGRDRPEIQQEYRRVKDTGLFPPRFEAAHFMENDREFFAVTASLYLFGDIQQPPFRCAVLAKLDAGYLAFLEAQFGPARCPALAGRPITAG
jgi:hypothetical protein